MANYSLSEKDKEQWKLQYSDLSESLQNLIDSKVDKTSITSLSKAMTEYRKFMNGMILTIGSSFPAHPTNNKNVHLNLSNKVLYVYTSSTWRPVTMIPQK